MQRNRQCLSAAVVGVALAALSLPLGAQTQQAEQNRQRRDQRQDQQQQQREQRRENQQERRDARQDDRPGNRAGQADARSDRAGARPRWERERIKPDALPGEIKEAIGKQTGQGEKMTGAVRITRGDETYYRVEVASQDRSKLYTLDKSGKIIDTENTTEAGRVVADIQSLPGEVKSTIQQESEGRPIKRVFQVTRDEETFYVAQIDAAEGLRTVRVGRDGEVLVAPRMLSERGQRGDAREDGRQRRDDAGQSNRYSGWERKETQFDSLPGPVKQALGREAAQDPVRNVVELSKDGQRVFQAEIVAAGGARTRMVRVSESGEILREANTTDAGREAVPYDSLPGEVKSTISKLTSGKQPEQVRQITRGGRTFYSFEHEGKRHFIGREGAEIKEGELPRAGEQERR